MQKPQEPFPWRFAAVVFVAVALILCALFYRPDPILWVGYRVRAVQAGFTPAAADLYASRALVQFHNDLGVQGVEEFLEMFPRSKKEYLKLPPPPKKGTPDRPVLPS